MNALQKRASSDATIRALPLTTAMGAALLFSEDAAKEAHEGRCVDVVGCIFDVIGCIFNVVGCIF